jgi:ABC-type branched-subunit amino acid transport system ATPase component
MLRDQYRCPHFHILVIGRANAGKTTILEKVCGVEKGTKPQIIIHDKEGKLNEGPMHFHQEIGLKKVRLDKVLTDTKYPQYIQFWHIK